MIEIIPIFIILWIVSIIIHELSHYIQGTMQGCKCRIKVWFWHGIPSAKCEIIEGKLIKEELFYLAGGLYTSIIYFITCIILLLSNVSNFIVFPFFSIATMHLFYSIYETSYYKNDLGNYMKYHYCAYLIGFIISLTYWIF